MATVARRCRFPAPPERCGNATGGECPKLTIFIRQSSLTEVLVDWEICLSNRFRRIWVSVRLVQLMAICGHRRDPRFQHDRDTRISVVFKLVGASLSAPPIAIGRHRMSGTRDQLRNPSSDDAFLQYLGAEEFWTRSHAAADIQAAHATT
jgi:hypothetical protein